MLRITLFLIVGFLFQQSAMAQYGYREPERGNRGYTPPPQARPSAYAERPKDSGELVELLMPFYVEKMQLDDFKKEILKTMLKEHYTSLEALRVNPSMKFGEKQDALSKLEDKLHVNLESIFSAEELEKFKTLQSSDELKESLKPGKKKKKKKKKRAKKNDTEKGKQ